MGDTQEDHLCVGPECRFCERPDAWRILAESKTFYVMASLGPLTEGHLLVISKSHVRSFGALPSEWLDEFISVRSTTAEVLTFLYGSVVCFEHGETGSCSTIDDDHCFHFHLHIIPGNFDLLAALTNEYETTRFATWRELHEKYQREPGPYLAVEARDSLGAALNPTDVPAHYLRTKFAAGTSEALFGDWQAFPSIEIIEQAVRTIGRRIDDKLESKWRL